MRTEQVDRSLAISAEVRASDIPDFIKPGLTVELFEQLHRDYGINFAVVDLDNMLVDAVKNDKGWYDVDEASVEALKQARSQGLLKEYYLLSNVQVGLPDLKKRVEYFALHIDTKFFHAATWPHVKPKPEVLQKALQAMGAKPEETVVIGDQLSKDVRGAHNIGALAVLRSPHVGEDPWYRAGRRKREQAIIKTFTRTKI